MTTRRRMAAILVALALALAGCDGDDGDDGGGGGSATDDATAQTDGGPPTTGIPAIVNDLSPSVVAVLVQARTGEGQGSGVVWDPTTVVTNAHVVRGASRVTVALASGERLQARVEARDPLTDLAILGVDGRELPPAEFADGLPQVGERAIAIGNPLGFEDTVTAGIVSGLDRAIPTGGRTPALVGLVQTDAAISPGNSGGALAGPTGEVIGVNVAFIPPQAQAVAIGFAIPAPQVRHVVTELLGDGEVEHAFLGVQLAPLTPQTAEQLGVDVQAGAVVLDTVPGSPAAEAGLDPGEAIVAIGGERVRRIEDVYAALRKRSPGDAVQVTVAGDGERQRVEVTLEQRE